MGFAYQVRGSHVLESFWNHPWLVVELLFSISRLTFLCEMTNSGRFSRLGIKDLLQKRYLLRTMSFEKNPRPSKHTQNTKVQMSLPLNVFFEHNYIHIYIYIFFCQSIKKLFLFGWIWITFVYRRKVQAFLCKMQLNIPAGNFFQTYGCYPANLRSNGLRDSLRIHVWYIYLHLVDLYGKCR